MAKQLDVINSTANHLPSTANLNLARIISSLGSEEGAADVEQWKQTHSDSKLIPFLSTTNK